MRGGVQFGEGSDPGGWGDDRCHSAIRDRHTGRLRHNVTEMAVINPGKGMIVSARAKDDVPPVRGGTISGQNGCDLIRRW